MKEIFIGYHTSIDVLLKGVCSLFSPCSSSGQCGGRSSNQCQYRPPPRPPRRRSESQSDYSPKSRCEERLRRPPQPPPASVLAAVEMTHGDSHRTLFHPFSDAAASPMLVYPESSSDTRSWAEQLRRRRRQRRRQEQRQQKKDL
jgi:hypothetical protein